MPTPSPSPVSTADLVGTSDWRALPDPATFGTGMVEAIVVVPGGYVAVGCEALSGIDCEVPAIWASADAVAWSEPVPLPMLPGETRGVARAVAMTPSGVVVGGFVLVGDRVHAALWFSTDSRSFERVADDVSFADAAVVALTTAGDRFVAVGSGAFMEFFGFRGWSSDDGRVWVDATPEQADVSFPVGVRTFGTGLVAWGPTCGVCPQKTAWWRSDDGLAWTATGNELGTTAFTDVTAVVERDDGLLAFGTIGGGDGPVGPAAWSLGRAADRWEPVQPPAQPEGTSIRNYLPIGSGAVLAGSSSFTQPATGLVWLWGPDDKVLRPALQLPGVWVIALLQDPVQVDRFIVIGRSSDGDSQRIVLWTGTADWAP